MPTADDLRTTLERFRSQLDAFVLHDWDVGVPGLTRTVRHTAEHLVDTIGFYTLHLLSTSPRRLPVDIRCHREAPNAAVLDVLAAEVEGLSRLASLVPRATRAFHVHGMADVSGFLAMACAELLVHGEDACRGLGVTFDADEDVARRVLERAFPWATPVRSPWSTLLWATGRRSLEGREDLGPDWAYHCAPLQEWDGTRPIGVRSRDGYEFDAGAGRWFDASP